MCACRVTLLALLSLFGSRRPCSLPVCQTLPLSAPILLRGARPAARDTFVAVQAKGAGYALSQAGELATVAVSGAGGCGTGWGAAAAASVAWCACGCFSGCWSFAARSRSSHVQPLPARPTLARRCLHTGRVGRDWRAAGPGVQRQGAARDAGRDGQRPGRLGGQARAVCAHRRPAGARAAVCASVGSCVLAPSVLQSPCAHTRVCTRASSGRHACRVVLRHVQGMYDKLDQLQPLVQAWGRSHRLDLSALQQQ